MDQESQGVESAIAGWSGLIAPARNSMNLVAGKTTHPLETIAIVPKAEDEARLLTDPELQQLCELAPHQASWFLIVAFLQDQAI